MGSRGLGVERSPHNPEIGSSIFEIRTLLKCYITLFLIGLQSQTGQKDFTEEQSFAGFHSELL